MERADDLPVPADPKACQSRDVHLGRNRAQRIVGMQPARVAGLELSPFSRQLDQPHRQFW
jgi:hypothetical protein